MAHGQDKVMSLTCSSDNCQEVGCIQNALLIVLSIESSTVKGLENKGRRMYKYIKDRTRNNSGKLEKSYENTA